jgi:phosphoglycerol transferase MdoB-like AlkP superfamily enzyme
MKFIPFSLRYFILSFFSTILVFTGFRLILLFAEFNQLAGVERKLSWLFQAFIMGFRFDCLVTAYLTSPLLLFLLFADMFKASASAMAKAGMIYCLIVFLPVFFICAADIPFYKQFGERFSSTAFEWDESKGFVLKLIFSNISYWGYLFLFLGFYVGYLFLLKFCMGWFLKRREAANLACTTKHSGLKIVAYFFALGLLFICMRGRVSAKSPMQEGTAFISEYMFINELGLNPVYTLYSSLDNARYSSVSFVKEKVAMDAVRGYLGIQSSSDTSPIERIMVPDGPPNKMNVVVVIMESMCTFKMGDYGGPNLTPHMDSLSHNSLYFNNIYSAGIHTFNGIYSTLYGFPGILQWQPLLQLSHIKYNGLSSVLKDAGYNTIYFTTHDDQFDNVGGFLRYNGFDRIVSQKDYPSNKVISVLGVPDHFMFDFSLPVLDSMSAKGSPFLCAYMTASDHGPWVIPTDIPFKPDAKNEQDRATQYADWAIGNFLKKASQHTWFKSTIFVFLGDHGLSMGHTYDLSLSFHHIPCIFYSQNLFPKGRIESGFGGQIDVFPTLLHLLNLPYKNTSMGVDLLKEKRSYIYFSDDDKVGCIGPKYYFIHRMIGNESLYEYSHLDKTNYLSSEPVVADSMRSYVFNSLQATHWLISQGKFGSGKQ